MYKIDIYFRLKSIVCMLLVPILVILMITGCGGPKITYTHPYYFDENGEKIPDDKVTLDIIAQCKYDKDFDDVRKEEDRQRVIENYISYHLPSENDEEKGKRDVFVKQLATLNITDVDLPSDMCGNLDLYSEFLGDASTALGLAELYANAKEDKGFEKYLEEVSKGYDVAKIALNISKGYFIIADLANNDVSNKQEYCKDLIDAFAFITKDIPVFGDYFSEGLSVVKEGVELVVENAEKHYEFIDMTDSAANNDAFFIREIQRDDKLISFAIIIQPDSWEVQSESGYAPTITDILKYRDDIKNISSNGLTYLSEYIKYRISFEWLNPDMRGDDIDILYEESEHTHILREEILKQATCTSKGEKKSYCRDCNEKKIIEIDKTPHIYEEIMVAPTYDEPGYTKSICKNCGESKPLLPQNLTQNHSWCGYGEEAVICDRRFDIDIDKIEEDYISGSLVISIFYETKHETTFEGVGKVSNDTLIYEVTFDITDWVGDNVQMECDTVTLIYNPADDSFTLTGSYNAKLYRAPQTEPNIIAENITWFGLGRDDLSYPNKQGHLFVMNITQITDRTIDGHFMLSYNDSITHQSKFIGRGYKSGNSIFYEVRLEKPRVAVFEFGTFWLKYDCEKDTLEINDSGYYVVMNRQDN